MKKRDHSILVSNIINKLEGEGYFILQKEYTVNGLLINNKKVRVDILCEKDGIHIPVECGKLRSPRIKRVQKLKEIFGILLHFPYNIKNKEYLKNNLLTLPCSEENKEYIETNLLLPIHRTKPTPLIYREGYDDENFLYIEGFYKNSYIYKLRDESNSFIHS